MAEARELVVAVLGQPGYGCLMRTYRHESVRSRQSRQKTRNWWERQLYAWCNLGMAIALVMVLTPADVWGQLISDPVGSVKQAAITWVTGQSPIDVRTK